MSINAGTIVLELRADDSNLSVTMRQAGKALQKFQLDAEQTAKSVKKLEEHQFSLATRFRHFITTLGALRFAVMDINDIFVRMPLAILKTAGELERMQMLMTGLSKETDKAARSAEGLRDFNYITTLAQNAPFEIGALSDAFVKLKVGGFDPAAGSMQALIDATARFGGTGETLKRATIAIQQMVGKGVVSMEELRQQLGEAVPTAIQDMADAMGMGMADLVKKISEGQVKSQGALDKMLLLMAVRNRGAAKDMMETWTGTVSRFQTQMQLASKEIADAGFAPAVKVVLNEITALLATDDFKRAAIDIGSTLKIIVEAGVSVVKFFYEWADAIKLVAGLWLFSKIKTNIFDALIGSAQKSSLELSKWSRDRKDEHQIRMGEFEQRRRVRAEDVALDMSYTAATERSSRARIIAAQNEMRFLANMQKQQQTQYAAMTAAMIAAGGKGVQGKEFGERGFIGQAAALAQIRQLEDAMKRTATAQAAANAVWVQSHAVNTQASSAIAKHSERLQELSRTSGIAYQAQRALAGAGSLLAAGIGLVGGPLGAISIALTAGAFLWAMWGESAAEAAARAQRALNRLSNQKDLDLYNDQLKDKEEKLRLLDMRVAKFEEGGTRYAEADVKRWRQQADQLRGEVATLRRTRDQAQIDVSKEMARGNERQIGGAIDDQLENTRRKFLEREAQEATFLKNEEKKLRDRGAKQEELNKLRNESARRSMLSEVQMKRELAAMENAAADSLNQSLLTTYKNSGNAQRDAIMAQAKQRRENARQYLSEAENAQKVVDRGVELMGKTPKGKGNAAAAAERAELFDSPIQKLIEQLRADKAGLEAELQNVLDGDNLEARIKAARQKLMQQWTDGKFDYIDPKTKKATQPELKDVSTAIDETEANMRREQVLKDRERFTKLAEELGPRYKEAIAMLADPFAKDGKKPSETTLGIEKILNSLSPERLAAAGSSVEQLRKMLSQSIVADYAQDFVDLERQTKELQGEMTSETRRGAQARAEAEDEAHRRIMQNLIDQMRLRGVDQATIDSAQAKLDANTAARTAATARKFETPMQKMVREWKDSTTAMEQATARWAQSSVDHIINMVRTGKFEWRDLVEQILMDILRIKMQKALAAPMESIFDSVGKWAGSVIGGGNPLMSAVGSFFGSIWPFAKGGVMTPFGAADLRTYAAGGIANSPQVAIYGEGSRPEAFVPLPDGRTIPVTIKGGGQQAAMPNVVVNVINQTGQQVSAQQGGARMDGKQVVLDVVLTAMSQPGPFRDGMKNMMRT